MALLALTAFVNMQAAFASDDVVGDDEDAAAPPPCDSEIYCKGGLHSMLHAIQMARIFPDSKTFVDMPMRHKPIEILKKYAKLQMHHNGSPKRKDLEEFVHENFMHPGSEFEEWEPRDWRVNITLYETVKDRKYIDLAKFIHRRWKDLGRKIKSDVRENPERYSLIYMENPFVVPGGRFREVYYWDSYWTILGLLVSGMEETVRGMLTNFAHLVDKYGLIPNGNRVYYTRRSQPPLYIAMMDEYHKATQDDEFILAGLNSMVKEFMFWIEHRTVTVSKKGKSYKLARYNVEVDMPRPEGYVEDFNLAEEFFDNDEEKVELYKNLKTGAESGLDYSAKWFVGSDGNVSLDLDDIRARHIVPVELNSYLCRNARVLAKFYEEFGNHEKAEEFRKWEDSFKTAIDQVLWNEEQGSYFDYDLDNQKQRDFFLVTNVAPLWAECFKDDKYGSKARKMISYMDGKDTRHFTGGVPTSLFPSGQQWDMRNIWPPMQELVATAMENTGLERGKRVARDVVNKYLQNVYCNFIEDDYHVIYEKYASDFYCGWDRPDKGAGTGGEYEVQEGFGWTNGVVMHFLAKYGDSITTKDSYDDHSHSSAAAPASQSSAAASITFLLLSIQLMAFSFFNDAQQS